MRLQKQSSRKIGDKEYFNYTVAVPPKTIEALGWKPGDKLTSQAENGKLTITKKQKARRSITPD